MAMDRVPNDRLWALVQQLLTAPEPPDDAALRRAARLLCASRHDAVELLLARALQPPADGPATAPAAAPAAEPAAPAGAAPGLRDATLLAAGVAGGVAVATLLGA
jgi:hypothetical protein